MVEYLHKYIPCFCESKGAGSQITGETDDLLIIPLTDEEAKQLLTQNPNIQLEEWPND